jgi:hypothetical protein
MSKNFQFILTCLILFALGGISDRYFLHPASPEKSLPPTTNPIPENKCESSDNELKKIKDKLSGVTETDIREYLRGQSVDEKLKKADEILGKMVLILIADIGYKISQEELRPLTERPTLKPVDTQPAAPIRKTLSAPTPKKPTPFHSKIFSVRGEYQKQDFLKEAYKTDFAENLKSSTMLTAQQVRKINGTFEGPVQFTDNRGLGKLTLSLQAEVRGNKLAGKSEISIYDKDGTRFSHGMGEGDLNKDYSSTGDAIFAQVGSAYLELYYFPNIDQIAGYLVESTKGNYLRVGAFNLNRVQ